MVSSCLLVMFVESKLVMLAIYQETRGIKAPNVDFASDLISAASKVQSRDITHFIRHSGFLAVGLRVNFPRHFNIEDN